VASSTRAAIHWRTAVTPTGPITPKASDPVAAPNWFDRAALSIIAGPASPASRAGRPSVAEVMMPGWPALTIA
jgi:hypothetical protein